MIVIKIELWPFPFGKARKRLIGQMMIYNDGTSRAHNRGNYHAFVMRKGVDLEQFASDEEIASKHVTRTARIKDWPRNSYSVWRLVTRALKLCFPEEKG